MNEVLREHAALMQTEQSRTEMTAAWRSAGLRTALLVTAILFLFLDTGASIVSIWWRSETFAHGFVIIPISAFLIWRKREELLAEMPSTSYLAVAGLAIAGLLWWLARLTGVLVVEQLSFVAMLPLAAWSSLGWRAVKKITFPLGFLFLAVPMGEQLIPPMMDFTASFAVHLIKLTGIPVYWEGTYFTIPSGSWSVVEGCSGVRYLIASVTLGFLYAYLTYRSNWRRLIFILFSFGVPVIANGLRAYMIVMIAHLSHMKLALGVDHIIYGWVFFGFVVFLLFWIGSYWREDDNPSGERSGTVSDVAAEEVTRYGPMIVLAGALVAVGMWPAVNSLGAGGIAKAVQISVPRPAATAGWHLLAQPMHDWAPRYRGMAGIARAAYEKAGQLVGVYLPYYVSQGQGRELVNTQNVMAKQKDPVWHLTEQRTVSAQIGGKTRMIVETVLRSNNRDYLVWHWNWIGGVVTSNTYVGKLLDAKDRVFGKSDRAAAVILYTPLRGQLREERAVLQDFARDMWPSILSSLKSASVDEARTARSG